MSVFIEDSLLEIYPNAYKFPKISKNCKINDFWSVQLIFPVEDYAVQGPWSIFCELDINRDTKTNN